MYVVTFSEEDFHHHPPLVPVFFMSTKTNADGCCRSHGDVPSLRSVILKGTEIFELRLGLKCPTLPVPPECIAVTGFWVSSFGYAFVKQKLGVLHFTPADVCTNHQLRKCTLGEGCHLVHACRVMWPKLREMISLDDPRQGLKASTTEWSKKAPGRGDARGPSGGCQNVASSRCGSTPHPSQVMVTGPILVSGQHVHTQANQPQAGILATPPFSMPLFPFGVPMANALTQPNLSLPSTGTHTWCLQNQMLHNNMLQNIMLQNSTQNNMLPTHMVQNNGQQTNLFQNNMMSLNPMPNNTLQNITSPQNNLPISVGPNVMVSVGPPPSTNRVMPSSPALSVSVGRPEHQQGLLPLPLPSVTAPSASPTPPVHRQQRGNDARRLSSPMLLKTGVAIQRPPSPVLTGSDMIVGDASTKNSRPLHFVEERHYSPFEAEDLLSALRSKPLGVSPLNCHLYSIVVLCSHDSCTLPRMFQTMQQLFCHTMDLGGGMYHKCAL